MVTTFPELSSFLFVTFPVFFPSWSFKCCSSLSDATAETEPPKDDVMAASSVPPAASTQHSRRQVTWRERFATAFHMDSFTSEGSYMSYSRSVFPVCLFVCLSVSYNRSISVCLCVLYNSSDASVQSSIHLVHLFISSFMLFHTLSCPFGSKD